MIDAALQPFQFPFMQNAFWIALIVAPPCALLSCFLVLKGWALMGDAVSHAVLPGTGLGDYPLLAHLPGQQGRVFMMREWLELSSEEICKELNLTPTNLYVQLHRARLRLRECLELNWFASPKAT